MPVFREIKEGKGFLEKNEEDYLIITFEIITLGYKDQQQG